MPQKREQLKLTPHSRVQDDELLVGQNYVKNVNCSFSVLSKEIQGVKSWICSTYYKNNSLIT